VPLTTQPPFRRTVGNIIVGIGWLASGLLGGREGANHLIADRNRGRNHLGTRRKAGLR